MAGRLLLKFLNYFFHWSHGLGSVGLMVQIASAGVPLHEEKVQTGSVQPSSVSSLTVQQKPEIGQKSSQFFFLWQGHEVTDKKKCICSPTSLDQGHHIPEFGQDPRTSSYGGNIWIL
jgi:hypothetical protein